MIACTSPTPRSNVHALTACVGPNAFSRPTVRRANIAPVSGTLGRLEVLTRRRDVRLVAAPSTGAATNG